MTVRARIPAISRDIELLIDETLSADARSEYLADFARGALAEAQAQNRAVLGQVPEHRSFVDGRETSAFDSVRPDGRIDIEFDLLQQVLEWIGEQLVAMSPVFTGTYARSHVVFADGIEAPPGAVPLDASEWIFINPLPYARKIEHGQSPQAPDGVYEAIAAVAAKRFGNLANVHFTYRGIVGGMLPNPLADPVVLKRPRNRRGQFVATGARRAYNQSDLRFPAIVVTL